MKEIYFWKPYATTAPQGIYKVDFDTRPYKPSNLELFLVTEPSPILPSFL